MRHLLVITAALLLSACAGLGAGGAVFAEADQPHATLMHLEQGDVTESIYPAVFVRVDGEPVLGGDTRKYIPVEPGKHTIRVAPDYNAILAFQPSSLANQPAPSIRMEYGNITLDLQAGMTYKIGVLREGTSWTEFKPVVVASWPSDEPQPDK